MEGYVENIDRPGQHSIFKHQYFFIEMRHWTKGRQQHENCCYYQNYIWYFIQNGPHFNLEFCHYEELIIICVHPECNWDKLVFMFVFFFISMGRKIDEFVKSQKINLLSFRRRPESSDFSMFWMPVEDPVFSRDQVRHDEIRLFTRPSIFKSQITNKSQIPIINVQNVCPPADWILVIGIYLKFEICNLVL